jgi:hypothetical protein
MSRLKSILSSSCFTGLLFFTLASLYPFISFLAHNIGETYYIVSILSVWALTFGAGVLAFLFGYHVFPKWPAKTLGVILGLCVIILFSFHHIEKVTADAGIYLGTIKILIWLGLVILACALGFFLSKSDKIVTILTFVMLGVLLSPVSQTLIGLYNQLTHSEASIAPPEKTAASSQQITEKPNVYWIIPDMYARRDILKSEYGYDNKSFLNTLKRRDFYVAEKSYSNFNSTKLSLSTTLAMEYYLPVQTELNSMLWQNKLQGKNAVVEKFKSMGYRYIHVEPGGNNLKTRCGGGEDLCLQGEQVGVVSLNEAHIGLMRLTPFYRITNALNLSFFSFDFTRIEDISDHVVPDENAPFFMFAHLLSPHPPARFDNSCDYIEQTDWELLGHGSPNVDAGYVQDIKCLNDKLLTLLDWIDKNDPKAIVILQADHGSFLNTKGKKYAPETIVEKSYWNTPLAIFNAYKVPKRCAKGLYPSISPVNNFPLVFSCIENTPFQPLDDRSFIQYRKPNFEKFHEEIYEVKK